MNPDAALWMTVEQAATGVLLLVEEIEPADFARSRLTRAEVVRQLRQAAVALAAIGAADRTRTPELDWSGWAALGGMLAAGAPPPPRPDAAADDAVWQATQALVPLTLSWLRVYRDSLPGLFTLRADAG
ncbi:MAG: hypothetical protein RLY78_802 [Pseudomonadota bacterium]|jgi:uncharacterized protein with HEPN domain